MKLPQNVLIRNIFILLLFGIGAIFLPLVIGFGITIFAFRNIKAIQYRIAIIVLVLVVTLGLSTIWFGVLTKTIKHDITDKNSQGAIPTITISSPSPTTSITSVPSTNNPLANNLPTGCNSELWKHIYNPSRLKIINQCIEVTGTVEVIRIEKDGDDHILLKLDSGQENLINQKNVFQQKGDLVLEPVCIHNVTQADAITACEGSHSNVVIPPVGAHVKVVGSFVLDTSHGWNEIHPVSQIVVTQ